jgi:hypothetical protein
MHDLFERSIGFAGGRHYLKYIAKPLGHMNLSGERALEFGNSGMSARLAAGFGAATEVLAEREKADSHENCKLLCSHSPGKMYTLVFSDCLLQKYSELQRDVLVKRMVELCEQGGHILAVVPRESHFAHIPRMLSGHSGINHKDLNWMLERNGLKLEKSVEGMRFLSVLARKV